MRDNILKSDRSKKQAKQLPTFEKYQLKNRTNVFAIVLATIVIMCMVCWILTGFGLVAAYYLFKTNHYVWASLIILIDILLVRSYIKSKP